MAMGASMSGSRDICSWVLKATPNTEIMMTAKRVVTLCLIQNLAILMGLRSPRRPAEIWMVPPSGVYLMALEATFIITWSTRSRSATMSGSPSSKFRVRVWPWRWASI